MKLHIGKKSKSCPVLKVHGSVMQEVTEAEYLGDILTSDGKNRKNLKKRTSRGIGAVSSILTILNQVSFGKHYVQIGLLLRESLLLNSMLNNVEVWHGFYRVEEKELEGVDIILLRKLLYALISTPNESFSLELGIVPISIQLKVKRLSYLHYLLKKNKNEMVSRFFWAQWLSPCKGDWVNLIKQDLEDLDIPEDLSGLSSYSKFSFKKYVRSKAKQLAFITLMSCKRNHSKMKSLMYTDLKTQDFYLSSELSADEVRSVFLFRVHMCQFSANFRGTSACDTCLLCRNHPDSQEWLPECKEIRKQFGDLNIREIIQNVYSECVRPESVRSLIQILRYREEAKQKLTLTSIQAC